MKPEVAGAYTLHVVVRVSCFEIFKVLHQVRNNFHFLKRHTDAGIYYSVCTSL